MGHIILNGTDSRAISGLLIQSLPPISKPMIRTQVEEIDGRDGDIITRLGYSAYDKTVKVGLFGNYDINAIIKFFDSQGIVTFSNEPDKYYRYEIIDQVDFDRLIRFRTADVTLHVQPFKFSTTEEAVTLTASGQTVTNGGNTTAKPTLVITGSGTINISLNGSQMFVIELGNEGSITIDTEAMEAQKEGVLKNRLVTGDYDNFVLDVGQNTITWTGSVTSIAVSNYSRWI